MKSFCGYFLNSFCKFIKPIMGRCSCVSVCMCVCVGVGVFARFKSNLLALLSSLATQQLFSHITYTQRVPNSMFTDLRERFAPAQLFPLPPHPLYIKKKLFLDILANDFSSFGLDREARQGRKSLATICLLGPRLSPCPGHVIIISWALESYGESEDCFVAATNCASN